MNFASARSKYKGNLNLFSYIGMLGDLAALGLVYGIYKYRKETKKQKLLAGKEQARLETL